MVVNQFDHDLTIYRPYTTLCHRTDEVRRAILLAVSGVDHCALVTDAHLAGITELYFAGRFGTSVRTLRSGDFAGLGGLTVLDFVGKQSSFRGQIPDTARRHFRRPDVS